MTDDVRERRRDLLASIGIGLIVFAVYAATGPGRIDIIDGQFRFEVTSNLLQELRPILRDPALPGAFGVNGNKYAFYGPGASIVAMPLVAIARLLDPTDGELARFLFSFGSALMAAFGAGVLVSFLTELGHSRRRALVTTAVACFATLTWPTATSTFDQASQGALLLAAVYFSFRAGRSRSITDAALSAAFFGFLLHFQPTHVVLSLGVAWPILATASRPLAKDRRLHVWLLIVAGFVVLLLAYNYVRFHSPFRMGERSDEPPGSHPVLGNPFVGAASLLLSPGKGILWFSPPIVLSAMGFRALARKSPDLARALLVTIGTHFALISSLAFFGGDWCWGPRYLAVVLPLCALPIAYLGRRQLPWASVVATAGLLVQLMAISVDHQRYFFERGFQPHFWRDAGHYYRDSQLLARPREMLSLIETRSLRVKGEFAPTPYRRSTTYSIFGPGTAAKGPRWMQAYPVFYLPRPWPLWVSRLPESRQPVDAKLVLLSLMLCTLGGALLILRAGGNGKIDEGEGRAEEPAAR